MFVAVGPAFSAGLHLCHVVAAHALCGRLQSLTLLRRNAVKRGLKFGLGQLQLGYRRSLHMVPAGGVLQHGGIAALLNIAQDGGHTGLNGRIGVRRPMQARLEGGLKLALGSR